MSSLFDHIQYGDYDACRRLIAYKPSMLHQIETYNGVEMTPLMWAAHSNAPLAISQLLLDHNVDVNAQLNQTQRTALYVAVVHGQTALVRLLCEYGAAVNVPGMSGSSPLHLAAAQGDVATTCVLVEYGADVNRPDRDGRTPLHLGASSRLEVCQTPVEHRADVNAMDVDRFTPLDTALLDFSEDEPIVLFLIDEGAETNRMPRRSSADCGTSDIARTSQTGGLS